MGLLTTNEAAKVLRLQPATIRKMIRDGRLEAIEVGGKRKRIDPHAIITYAMEHSTKQEN